MDYQEQQNDQKREQKKRKLMRIALVTIAFPKTLEDDPPFRASWELAVQYAAQGHDVLVLTLADEDAGEDVQHQTFGKIQVLRKRFATDKHPGLHVPPMGTFFRVLGQSADLYNASLEKLREFKPDVIECQEFNGLGFFFADSHEYPLVIRCHGPLATLLRCGILGKATVANTELVAALELSTLAEADGIISLCDDLVDELSSQSHIEKDRFTVIRTPFSRLPSQKQASSVGMRETIWAKDTHPRLLFWGRVERQKGCDTLAECLPHIKKEFPNFALVIAGSEPLELDETRPYADSMREKLKEYGVDTNVKFLGFMPRATIESAAKEADLCLFPSQYETASYSCLEAMSYGACVIASKVGGLKEYVRHGETGWHVPVGDATALSKAIITLTNDADLRHRLGSAARESIATMCDPQKIAQESLSIYQRAIERHKLTGGARSPAFKIFAEKLSLYMYDWSLVQHIRDLGEEIYGRGWKQGYAEGLAAARAEAGQSGFPDANTNETGAHSKLSGIVSSVLRSIKR